jgi:hypothetical protein
MSKLLKKKLKLAHFSLADDSFFLAILAMVAAKHLP